jgi:cysteinyl-tRNA synthetase
MADIFLHDSAARGKRQFEPLDPQHVKLYVCGPTVYDLAHLGNARPVVVFDVLARLLRRLYPRVTYARNITDVDDKINARARDSGEPIAAITARTTEDFHADMAALGALPPDVEPRATGHIAEMITLIERLIANGHAYAADGHVLFSVPSFANYGKLSGRSPDELLAGARVDVAPYKRDAGDFVLWKPSDAETPGWDSPWGRGRPGWHIECSAMSWKHLGESFDIHGGGHDLIFPHHENEVAQSVCAFPGAAFARFWMHNGMLLVDGEKMSKSLGNFLTVRDILKKGAWAGEAFRLFLLKTHYRSSIDFSFEALEAARVELNFFYESIGKSGATEAANPKEFGTNSSPHLFDFERETLCDDLNTAGLFADLHATARQAQKGQRMAGEVLLHTGQFLGIFQTPPKLWQEKTRQRGTGPVIAPGAILTAKAEFIPGAASVTKDTSSASGATVADYVPLLTDKQINDAIAARNAARKAKDWAEADRIRDELKAQGIILEDGPTGTSWKPA